MEQGHLFIAHDLAELAAGLWVLRDLVVLEFTQNVVSGKSRIYTAFINKKEKFRLTNSCQKKRKKFTYSQTYRTLN